MASAIGVTPVTRPFSAIEESYAGAQAGQTSGLEKAAVDPRIRGGAAVFKFDRQLKTANERVPKKIGKKQFATVERFQQTNRHVIIRTRMMNNVILRSGIIPRGMISDSFA